MINAIRGSEFYIHGDMTAARVRLGERDLMSDRRSVIVPVTRQLPLGGRHR